MDQTEAGSPPEQKYLTVHQAAFIGVSAMVGAGIFWACSARSRWRR